MVKRLGTLRAPSALEPRLGPLDAAAIVVSNVIGGGIFFVPQIVAGMVPHPWAVLGVWLLGGLLSFAGAMAYAELAAARPRAGAEYVYLRDAFGRLPAFLTGWTSFVAGFSGAIAASAVALAEYLGRFVPAAGDATPLVTVPLPLVSLVVSRKTLVALAAIAALSFVHVRGLGPGRLVQNTLAGLKVSGLLLFVALGLSLGHGNPANLSTGAGPVTVAGVLLALVPVMFTYSGWNAAAYVAEEVRDPGRNVPRALALGTAAVTLIYLALNVLFLYATPVGELSGLRGGLIDGTSDRLFTFGLADWIAAFTIVSIAASISAMTIAGPRVYFAMARDGLFLGPAARVHPRFHTPALSIVAQALWSGVLVLCGTLSQLLSYTGFAVVLFSGVAVASLFVLRRRDRLVRAALLRLGLSRRPGGLRPRLGGARAQRDRSRPGPALAGLGVMAAGVPVYWWMRADGARCSAPGSAGVAGGARRGSRARGGGARRPGAQAATPARAQATAVAVEGIRVDGVLDEPAWAQRRADRRRSSSATPTRARRPARRPRSGSLFDADNLYFGILCRDRTPSAIVATQLAPRRRPRRRRPRHDRARPLLRPAQRLLLLGEPGGRARRRADLEQRAGARASSGTASGTRARASRTRAGWPRSRSRSRRLRFKPGQTAWGLNVERQIKRWTSTTAGRARGSTSGSRTSPRPGSSRGSRACSRGAGSTSGPYVSGGEENERRASQGRPRRLQEPHPEPDRLADRQHRLRRDRGGRPADQPHPLRPLLPGEAHVLPRRRGRLRRRRAPRRRPGPPPDLVPFFSRTIGLLEGQEVPILLGARSRVASRGSTSASSTCRRARRRSTRASRRAQNLLAARVSRNFFEQSWVGAIATRGNPTGPATTRSSASTRASPRPASAAART